MSNEDRLRFYTIYMLGDQTLYHPNPDTFEREKKAVKIVLGQQVYKNVVPGNSHV